MGNNLADNELIPYRDYHQSEQAFSHAVEQGIILGPRRMVKAVIRCNQLKWDGYPCTWSKTIESRSIDIENNIQKTLGTHIRVNHPTLNVRSTVKRRWTMLKDIGG